MESTSKNTSKKIAQKKIYITPTQKFDVKGQNTGSQKGHFFENPIDDEGKPSSVLESPIANEEIQCRVFPISIPVSRNSSPKLAKF